MYSSSKPYPYLPEGRTILYVPIDNPFMARAYELWKTNDHYCRQSTAAVIVKGGEIIGEGQNGGDGVLAFCPREALRIPSGQGYEFCPGCNAANHGEAKAIRNLKIADAGGADLYLAGHWWCCKDCWQRMIAAKIRKVYLMEGATEEFGGGVTLQPLKGKNISAFIEIADGSLRTLLERALMLAAIQLGPRETVTAIMSLRSPTEFMLERDGQVESISFTSDADLMLKLSLALSELK